MSTPTYPREWCFAGVIAIYCVGYLAWYSTTALGRYPVLDEREILQLARLIASGTLPAEAFYRAPLFSAILAIPLWFGFEPAQLPLLARAMNGALHLGSTLLAWQIAGRLWASRTAQYTATTLIGFNPILLHFSGDALDITCAIAFMMLGLKALVDACASPGRNVSAWARSSGWFALSALTRPQMLALSCVLPLLGGFFAPSTTARVRQAIAAAVPALGLLFAFGMVNHHLANEFRVLPWQGAYNFWAANRPGAHGRYFEQTIPIHTVDETANTTRLESEILFRLAAPDGAQDYRAQSAYWRSRSLRAIDADPMGWLARVARKSFYLLNNEEQYNNKTYSFHKVRSPWLRWNPLGWSLLLGLGILGGASALRRPGMQALLICAAAYAAGVLLYYVSDRFRAPLLLFSALCAGGCWQTLGDRRHRLAAVLLALMVTAASLWPVPSHQRTQTYVQDYLALGRAHSQLGEHVAARRAAAQAVARDPGRLAAQALLCISRFNAWLHDSSAELPPATLVRWQDTCDRAAGYSPAAARLLGYLEWRAGKREAARRRWEKLVDENNEEREQTLAWLVLTGDLRASDLALVRAGKFRTNTEILALVLAYRGDQTRPKMLATHSSSARLAREFASLRRLFDTPEPAALPPPAVH